MGAPYSNLIFYPGFSTPAANFFASAPTITASRKRLYDALLFRPLVQAGLWYGLDVFYVFATESASVALRNLTSNRFTASIVVGPSFVADRGYLGNNTSGYIESGWNASTDAVQYTLNNMHLSMYCNVNNTEAGSTIGVVDATPNGSSLALRQATDAISWRANQTTAEAGAAAVTNSIGLFSSIRTGSPAASSFFYRNGVLTGTGALSASVSVPNGTLKILTLTGAAFSARQACIASVGAARSTAQEKMFFSIIRNYLNAVGVP